MFRKLFQENPSLKLLLPLLFLVLCWIFYIKIFTPKLAYRLELLAKVEQLEHKLISIQKTSQSFSSLDKDKMEEEIAYLKESLGVGLYSPEIVRTLEKRAGESRVVIDSFVFQEPENNDTNQKRVLNLGVKGNYSQIREFIKSLEEYPAYAGVISMDINPMENNRELQTYMQIIFVSVPDSYPKVSGSLLPVREHPFRG